MRWGCFAANFHSVLRGGRQASRGSAGWCGVATGRLRGMNEVSAWPGIQSAPVGIQSLHEAALRSGAGSRGGCSSCVRSTWWRRPWRRQRGTPWWILGASSLCRSRRGYAGRQCAVCEWVWGWLRGTRIRACRALVCARVLWIASCVLYPRAGRSSLWAKVWVPLCVSGAVGGRIS